MTIEEAIKYLQQFDPNTPTKESFGSPCSYRGDYYQLAFEKNDYSDTVGGLIDTLKNSIGKTYTGYKGGEFTMNEYTNVYLVDEYSNVGEELTSYYFKYILGE